MEIMDDEDQAVFVRSTTARERQLSTGAPGVFLVVAAVAVLVAVVLWVVVDDVLVALILAGLSVLTGVALAVPAIWSLRHRERAALVVGLRSRGRSKALREHPRRWFMTFVPLGALTGVARIPEKGDPAVVYLLAALGGATFSGVVLGLMVWWARRPTQTITGSRQTSRRES